MIVGDGHSIALPDWGRPWAGRGGLRGLRDLPAHLRNERLKRGDRTDLLLPLNAMVTVGADGNGLPLAHTVARAGFRPAGSHPL